MTLSASEVASLTNWLSLWEVLEYLFGALVAVACFGEYAADFTNLFSKGDESKKKRLARGSTLLLIASLAFELICLVRTNQVSGQITGSLFDKANEAYNKSGTAITASDKALRNSIEADSEMDSLQKKAEALSGTLSGVQRKTNTLSTRIASLREQVTLQTPRWQLLEDGKAEFISKLRPFAGQSIVVLDCGLNPEPEPYRLAQDIMNFIGMGESSAYWKYGYKQWSRCGAGGGTSYGGNSISVSSAAKEGVKSAALELSTALNSLGIYTVLIPVADTNPPMEAFLGADSAQAMASHDQTSIFLLVGANPMFNISGFGKVKSNK